MLSTTSGIFHAQTFQYMVRVVNFVTAPVSPLDFAGIPNHGAPTT